MIQRVIHLETLLFLGCGRAADNGEDAMRNGQRVGGEAFRERGRVIGVESCDGVGREARADTRAGADAATPCYRASPLKKNSSRIPPSTKLASAFRSKQRSLTVQGNNSSNRAAGVQRSSGDK